MNAFRIMIAAVLMMTASPSAQWLGHPTPGIPRTPDGKPNLDAPAPKTADGKPDISGLWLTRGIYIGNIARDLKEEPPMQPWAAALYKQRRDNLSKDDPTGRCVPGGVPRSLPVPSPFRSRTRPPTSSSSSTKRCTRRQVFTDGRPLPKDPNPNWRGYSVGRWEGDTFVVESSGFNDNVWLDNNGHPAGESLRVTERFRRKTFGSMDVEITIDDPKTYTRPWNVTIPLAFQPDTEMLEYICPENEKDYDRLQGKGQ